MDLVTVANPGATTIQTEYYIELPQTSKPMTNGAGAAYNLTTFHGTADLRTLTEEQVRAEILDFTLQDGPVELQPASFGVTSARTDSLAFTQKSRVKSRVLLTRPFVILSSSSFALAIATSLMRPWTTFTRCILIAMVILLSVPSNHSINS